MKQKNHEFLFGCGAFDTLPYTSPSDGENMSFLEDRIQKWLGIYNYGTIPFYWGGFEPKEGQPETESRMKAARFLNSHNVKVKGHPLCWHTACADWLMQYDNETILRKQRKFLQQPFAGRSNYRLGLRRRCMAECSQWCNPKR